MKEVQNSLQSEKLLNHPIYNKGTAFTAEERDAFHLHGLLPFHVSTLEEQVIRRYQNFLAQKDPLAKYTFLSSLQDRNEVLFYRLVLDHISEMLPFIYTPTIGEVSLQFSALYQQHRGGVYLSYPLQDKIEEIIANLPQNELDVVVVTDGERILGLGDLGVGGMAIPQGKLSLYTLFGGIHPLRTLPILLDVGTNNQTLLQDPLYLGWRCPRISDNLYYDFIDRFVKSLKKRFPKVLLQWEDFSKKHAKPLLKKYQDIICSFNDDIQGTAAVTLSALLSAIQGALLSEQKIVVFGAGSTGLGISHLIVKAMQEEGCSEQRARENFYILDRQGLIHADLSNLDSEQKKFARDYQSLQKWEWDSSRISLLEVIKQAKPTVLIGVSTQAKAFTKEVITEMGKYVENPIVFPLSNPNSHSEATPEELIYWTKGRAIIATGSPFASIDYNNKQYTIAQCNNVYIFPGVGLGAIAAKIPKITDEMFIQAAYVLSKHSRFPDLFPPLKLLREVSREIALAVIATAENQELIAPMTTEIREKLVDQTIWFPSYPSYSFK